MSRLLEVRLSSDPAEILPKARQTAKSNGIQLTGDQQAGRFTGNGMAGTYRINGDMLAIVIQKKPFIMPWPMIESAVRSFFA